MKSAVAALLVLAAALPAAAQVRPQPGPGDPRIQIVPYDPDQVVQLQVTPGYQLSVEFAPDERIENVAIGDTSGWIATPNRRGDHLFLKPAGSGTTTNMTVVTDAHTYEFELTAGGGGGPPPFAVRFSYPAPPAVPEVATAATAVGRYRLSGTTALLPTAMADDGAHTTIVWTAGQTLPAIFSIGRNGRESLVNGAMRGDQYVVDSIADRYVFRLDHDTAYATRVPRLRRR